MTVAGEGIKPGPTRRRWRPMAAIVLAVGVVALAGAGAWGLARSDFWRSPLDRAERAMAAGDLRGAGLILDRLVRDEPRRADVRLAYARFLRRSGLAREADVALARAQDLGAPEAGLAREFGLLVAGPDFRAAEPFLAKALAARPEDGEVLGALADGYSRQGRWPDAADLYARLLTIEPGRPDAAMGRARALVQAGRGADAAAELRALLADRPDDYEARLLLASTLLNDADLAAAEPELERARRLRPDRPEPLAGLASCAVAREDWGRARDLLDRAIALDPASLLALVGRAELGLARGDRDAARADFERVVALDPAHKAAHLHLAQLYHRLGDRDRAREHEQAFHRLQAAQEAEFRTLRGAR